MNMEEMGIHIGTVRIRIDGLEDKNRSLLTRISELESALQVITEYLPPPDHESMRVAYDEVVSIAVEALLSKGSTS